MRTIVYFVIFCTSAVSLHGAERPATKKTDAPTAEESIEALVKRTMPSIVVIRGTGRDGKQDGLGSGFIVDRSGLIVTNLHVIGEGREFVVETSDGRKLTPVAVHASDRNFDLAVVRVDAKNLPALPLGDSDDVDLGQEVVALGNPQGLEHSVVKGVVSGSREIEGLPLIQLAIPIEPGNSGGPVLDRTGRVLGVVTMKSQVTDNLGFAVKVNAVKPLLAKPNTVVMDRWMTIGAIDPKRWEPLFGSKWRQRAGRIHVEGAGAGFGGRSLCLARSDPPAETFELGVTVKLADEAGAAGLAFAADGNQRHYGFYPTNGRLRLTRFDGSDVYSWTVLGEKPSDAYVPGDWNRLKVRVEPERVRCYVNGVLVFDEQLRDPPGDRVGLAKFRATEAEFKQFEVAKELADAAPSELAALRDRAKQLDREAEQLRHKADVLARKQVVDQLASLFDKPDGEIDLLRAALLVARLDNEEIDVDAYVDEVARMADEVRGRFKKGMTDEAKLAVLNKYLFDENGYHGSRRDYYNRSNSYLNEVIDDREGLPITMAVLYVEVGRRAGLPLAGVGLPGHFLAALVDEDRQVRKWLDPYDGGAALSEDDAKRRSIEITGREPDYEQLQPVTKRAVVLRMLENLLNLSGNDQERTRLAGYLDAILALSPENMERRMVRAMVRYQGGMYDEAIADVDYLLEHHRADIDEERVLELRDRLERERREK